MKVDKPARYIGNEFNSVMKDTSQVNIRFAMCFPDVYEIGMSHLGIQILYDMFVKKNIAPLTDKELVACDKTIIDF